MTDNMLKIRILSVIILSFCFLQSFAQLFDESQSPLGVKWRLIEHGGFKVIYPTPLEKEAQRMANTFAHIYPHVGKTIGERKTTIPIVLQNQGTTSNGFVQLAPKKSQFYTMPPQDFDSQDWLNNLAIHELRHVAQFNKLTGKVGFPFPEEIYFGYIGVSMPIWFLEGDAVSTETDLTQAGRGRQPNWIMPFRTAVISGRSPSYSKAYFGSEKDAAIGYYQLGYLMNTQLQKNFGVEIGDQLLSDIHKRPLRLYPFSNSLKKFTGKNTKNTYLETITQLKADWQNQAALTPHINYVNLTKTNTYETNYFLPIELEYDRILTLKQSKSQTPAFVIINANKNERMLFKIGYQEQPWFSYGADKIVWDERREDPRFKQRTYNVICIYDLKTGKKRQLTQRTRLFSPSISADGQKLVAVQADLSNRSSLVMIDMESGKIIDNLPNPTNDHLQMPALNYNGSKITWISVNEQGKSLWLQDSMQTVPLIKNTKQQISKPIFLNDKIVFNAHLSGVDNIYELTPQSGGINALTAAKYGAFNAGFSKNHKELLFNNYQINGYEIAKTTVKPLPVSEDHFVYYGQSTAEKDYLFLNIPDSNFKSKPYRILQHSFNFHSISPTVDDGAENIGLALKSNDLLNTTSVVASVRYESSLGKLAYKASLQYKALYPVFSLSFANEPRRSNYRVKYKIYQAAWREDQIHFNASLPLSFSAFNHRYNFSPSVGTYYVNRHLNGADGNRLVRRIEFPMNYKFTFNHQVRSAVRDIAPKWAQIITLKYQNLPFEKNITGKLFAFESYFYFPGIARNHTFLTSFNYQDNSGTFKGSADIPTVYGYYQIKAKNLLKNTLLLNYRFPFLYPDLEIGPFAYVRNLRATFFSHYENIGHERSLSQPKTFGLELRSDMNLLRYQPVADVGVRLIFIDKIYNQNPIFELLFNYQF